MTWKMWALNLFGTFLALKSIGDKKNTDPPWGQTRGLVEPLARFNLLERGSIMRLTRWQPFVPVWNQLDQLQKEMGRIFERWGDGSRSTGLSGGYPPLNVWEEGDTVFVEAELPGLELNDLEIYINSGNQLTLKGERKQKDLGKGVWHRQERGFGSFVRSLTLPFQVNADNVDASFQNGVLRIKLAKHESAKPRKIQVKADN
jgi:HSP20 family protein